MIVRLETERGSFQALADGPVGGPPVLLLHGFPDTPITMTPLVELLAAAGFRVTAPWLRGYAPSTLDGPYDLDTLAADVVALADRVAPGRRVALIGHDWGALVTYNVCAVAAERVSRAVTLAVPHPLAFLAGADPHQLRRSWYIGFFQLPGAERVAAASDFALVDRLWRTWSPGYRLPDAEREELHRCLRASWPAPLLYYRALLRPLGPALRRIRRPPPRLRRMTVPLLYLHGADDGCVGPEVARGAERFFTAAYRADEIAGAGHFLCAERPDLVAERAAAWLAAADADDD